MLGRLGRLGNIAMQSDRIRYLYRLSVMTWLCHCILRFIPTTEQVISVIIKAHLRGTYKDRCTHLQADIHFTHTYLFRYFIKRRYYEHTGIPMGRAIGWHSIYLLENCLEKLQSLTYPVSDLLQPL